MSLSVVGQNYFDHAKSALPRLLFQLLTAPLDVLGAYAKMMESYDSQLGIWLTEAYIKTSTGIWLDQHARDYGTSRRAGETDAALRERLGLSDNVVVARLLLIQINQILVGAGFPGTAVIVETRRDKAFLSDITSGGTMAFISGTTSESFMYRIGGSGRPYSFVVILPYPTDAATAAAVREFLRQAKAAGFGSYVEVRTSP